MRFGGSGQGLAGGRYAGPMIVRRPFGRTGFESSRVLFGAAALAAMKPDRVEATLALVDRYGVNHVDTAAGYGESERRLADWLVDRRDRVFLATKTTEREGPAARASLERSLERMGVERVDSIQLHNLVEEADWQQAMGPGGALESLVAAREEGLVTHLGVTGHGTLAPAMHLRSLEVFPFASVLCPFSYSMMAQPEYAADFERLATVCRQRGVALQTIKSVARRRWPEEEPRAPRFSWYEPLEDPGAVARAVRWVLAREDVFLNSSSDARLLEPILRTAVAVSSGEASAPDTALMERDQARFGIEPLFVRGVSDAI